MISFDTGEPVRIPDCHVKEGGEYSDLDLVPVSKFSEPDIIYTFIQAHWLKTGDWK